MAHKKKPTKGMEANLDILSDAWQTQWMPALQDGLRHLHEHEREVLIEAYGVLPKSEQAGPFSLPESAPDKNENTLNVAIESLLKQEWAKAFTKEQIVSFLQIAGQSEWGLKEYALSEEESAVAERILKHHAKEIEGGSIGTKNRAQDRPLRKKAADTQKRNTLFGRYFKKTGPAVVLGLVLLYGCLALVSYMTRPPHYEQAKIDAYAHVLSQNIRTEEALTSSFLTGAHALLDAHSSYLGLFPSYKEPQVSSAIIHLEEAYNASSDPMSKARAAFFLAKAHLMNDNLAEAKTWLQLVLDQNVKAYRTESEALIQAL